MDRVLHLYDTLMELFAPLILKSAAVRGDVMRDNDAHTKERGLCSVRLADRNVSGITACDARQN